MASAHHHDIARECRSMVLACCIRSCVSYASDSSFFCMHASVHQVEYFMHR